MKMLLVTVFFMGFFITSNGQSANVITGPTCNCPVNWGSCTASCLFTDCCICFNPATSEGGCACYWGFASCKSAPFGVAKSAGGPSSADAKTSFAFDLFNEYLGFLKSQKIDVSKLSRDFQSFQSRYPAQSGKIPVAVQDYNNLYISYSNFIEGLIGEQKSIVKAYIDSKEKNK